MVLKIIICILAVIGVISLLYEFIQSIIAKSHMDGEHFCNDCKAGFITRKQYYFKYCPYCRKKLTYHEAYLKWLKKETEQE